MPIFEHDLIYHVSFIILLHYEFLAGADVDACGKCCGVVGYTYAVKVIYSRIGCEVGSDIADTGSAGRRDGAFFRARCLEAVAHAIDGIVVSLAGVETLYFVA